MEDKKLKIALTGINHKTASILDLEPMQFARNEVNDALKYFRSCDGVEGITIISTCNRVEFYFTLSKNLNPFDFVNEYYLNKKGTNISRMKESFYCYYESDVSKHLFRVICGLDSMVLGEYQIQGQIKDAYSAACSVKAADKMLHKLFHAAFRIGKSVRSKTKIGSGKQSVSGIAFQILKETLNNNDSVALIGVNQNTKIIAEKLNANGFSSFTFLNRTLYKAEKLADQFSGQAYNLEKVDEAISNVNCIFSCTGAPGYIINSDLLNRIYNKTHRLKLIIDIAVPRDIETSGIPEKVMVYDLEALKNYLKNKQKTLALDLPEADSLINNEVKLFEAWSESQGDESIAYFDEKFESLRLQFLEETKEKISEEEFQMFDKLSKSLLHRIKSTIHQVVKNNKSKKIAS